MSKIDQEALREKILEIVLAPGYQGGQAKDIKAEIGDEEVDQLLALMVEYGRECRVDELRKANAIRYHSYTKKGYELQTLTGHIAKRLSALQKEEQ